MKIKRENTFFIVNKYLKKKNSSELLNRIMLKNKT